LTTSVNVFVITAAGFSLSVTLIPKL
jgi:hypothetical protein